MPRKSPALTLGACMAHSRTQLHLSQAGAAHAAGVARLTWIRWETNAKRPGEANWPRIEDVLGWPPGSVAAILDGQPPVSIGAGLATVTPLRPDAAHAPPDPDEAALVAEWEDMRLPESLIRVLVEEYRADKAGADQARREHYRDRARREARG